MKKSAKIITGMVFASFHILTVVLTLINTGGSGEGQAMLVIIIDYPLVLLLGAVPGGSHILYGSTTAYIFFFSIVGTLMYALVGFLLGLGIDKLKRTYKTSPNKSLKNGTREEQRAP